MRQTRISLAVAVLVMGLEAGPWGQTVKPDFSGIWILDVAKSNFSSMQSLDSYVLTIAHKEPTIRVSSVQKTGTVETTKDMHLATGGEEVPNVIRTTDGDQMTKSVSKWEDKRLVTTYRVRHIGHFDDVRDTWDLSDDGKLLIILREVTLPDRQRVEHRYSARMFFKKK